MTGKIQSECDPTLHNQDPDQPSSLDGTRHSLARGPLAVIQQIYDDLVLEEREGASTEPSLHRLTPAAGLSVLVADGSELLWDTTQI